MKIKLKTNKSAAKRFKITGSGKVMKNTSGKRHILSNKSSKLKRNKRGFTQISKSDLEKVRACLPGLK
ncbi:50S ribosomal protein L35 [bacterium]|nr:50S ribosomal protein L35 [bacterium]